MKHKAIAIIDKTPKMYRVNFTDFNLLLGDMSAYLYDVPNKPSGRRSKKKPWWWIFTKWMD